jgi:mRNA-degrading endonuclease toxin of MazEF toxin-antitoxin module
MLLEAREQDSLCMQYKQNDNFWTDEGGVLYHKEGKGRPCIVITEVLVETVLVYHHELPFTANQGVHRTIGFISTSIGGRR